VQTSLNGRIAVIVLPDKSYTIEIYGPQTSGELVKNYLTRYFLQFKLPRRQIYQITRRIKKRRQLYNEYLW